MPNNWLNKINWSEDGLIPVIVQEESSGKVLMFAWMNRESLAMTAQKGEAVYFSRSRGRLWHKGEESGHVQRVKSIRTDCDKDVVLITIEQVGNIACHTGRHSCFHNELDDDAWNAVEPVLKDPCQIYNK